MAGSALTWLAAGLVLVACRPDWVVTLNATGTSPVHRQDTGSWSQAPATGPTLRSHAKRSQAWWRGEEALLRFGIGQNRSSELEGIFQGTLPILKTTQADVARKEAVVATLLANAHTTSESAIIQAIEDLEMSRRSLARTFTMMQYHMYRRLTASQRAKIQAYLDHSREERDKLPTTSH